MCVCVRACMCVLCVSVCACARSCMFADNYSCMSGRLWMSDFKTRKFHILCNVVFDRECIKLCVTPNRFMAQRVCMQIQ
jgi:hypothetical protein